MLREVKTPIRLTEQERQALAALAAQRGEGVSATLRGLIYQEASRYGLLPEKPPVVKMGRPRKTAVEA